MAIKALLNLENIKLDGENLIGLKDQTDKAKIIILEYPFGKVNFCKSKYNNIEYCIICDRDYD